MTTQQSVHSAALLCQFRNAFSFYNEKKNKKYCSKISALALSHAKEATKLFMAPPQI